MIIHKYAIRSIYDERGGRGFPAHLEILDKMLSFQMLNQKKIPI